MESLYLCTAGPFSKISMILLTIAALINLDPYSRRSTVMVDGFSNAAISHRCRSTIPSSQNDHCYNIQFSTNLFAEAGPPKYQKLGGLMQKVEQVGKGSYLLTIDYDSDNDDEKGNGEKYPEYEPGHVLALEIQPPPLSSSSGGENEEEAESSSLTTMTEKTKNDLEKNDGWLRGPYTVSFGYGSDNADADDNGSNQKTNDGFKVLVKEVGYKSHVFATSKLGTPVVFGGKFHVPIAEGIRSAATAAKSIDNDDNDDESRGETRRVVLVSSGVGVGPCVGAIEELLTSSSDDTETIDSIDLIASYRTSEEISMVSALEKLQKESNGDDNKPCFHWKPVVTSEAGRISSNGPESLRDDYLQSSLPAGIEDTNISPLLNTHYHIIGNGQLVTEWKEGLAKAGVPSSRITVESYFNHSAEPDAAAIDTIREAVLGLESKKRVVQTQ